MKLTLLCGAALLAAVSILHGGEPRPTIDEVKARLSPDHPRLFIQKAQLPAFRERANGVCKVYLDEMKAWIDAMPEIPAFELKTDAATFDGKKVTFSRLLNDQNSTEYAFKYHGGFEAAGCAILYHATGDRKYLEKGWRYMMHLIEFCKIARNSRILPEWYNNGRLCGLFAYDMFYNDLTPEQRKNFIVPLLDYLEHMRRPGYTRNGGGIKSGNYGEDGLWWFAGLTAYKDGYADALAEKFLEDGWKLNCAMMDYRDKVSGGKGLLTSICAGYSFGAYPWATHLFLLTMKNACNIDGTKFWSQPREYARYFNWMMIRSPLLWRGLGDYGWGDAFHVSNTLPTGAMYTHLAHIIHLYGDSEFTRALMSVLDPREQQIVYRKSYPWTNFVLTGFDPSKKFTGDAEKVLNQKTAEFFPTYGLLNMRSGVGYSDTYASFKAGATESGHQHYDELGFVIFKHGYQAMNTGNRGLSANHLVYYVQTIAHNALLIRMPEEPLAPYWYPGPKIDRTKVFNDGGQNRQRAARNLGVDIGEYHAASVGDATACYSGFKCKEAVRHFVYVKPDYFIVYDRLTSVKPDQQKVFLLHAQKKPEKINGVWKSRGGDGALFVKTVLPADAGTEAIGGPGKEFWVQGQNYPVDANITKQAEKRGGIEKTWLGCWRLEITPGKPALQDRFLTVMQAAHDSVKTMVGVQNVSDKDFDGVRFTTREGITVTAKFRRNGRIQGFLKLEKDGKILVDKALNPPADVMQPQYTPKARPVINIPPGMARQARVDVYLTGQKPGLKPVDQGTARIAEAQRWMQGPGRAGALSVYDFTGKDWQKHHVTMQVSGDGQAAIRLMGPDVRKDGKFRKVLVDYRKLTVNGKVLYDGKDRFLSLWHNEGKVFRFPVKDGEKLHIEIICRPAAVK